MITTNPFGLTKVKNILAISSCKGGVGKSTIAAGLARALFAQGFKVGLLDADLYGPSLPSLFNIGSVHIQINEFKMMKPVEAEGLKLMSFGFLLGDAPAVMRGPIVTRYIQQLLLQTDWGQLDYLLIDMPPGTGDVQLTITQSVRLSGAVIVTTPQTLSLIDVARGILMFEKVQVPMLGIIENMAYFVCDNCNKKHDVFGVSRELEQRFGLKTLVQIPLIPQNDLTSFMQEAAKAVIQAQEQLTKSQAELPEVGFDEEHIYLKKSNGKEIVVKNHDVRAACMCAMCINEMTGKKTLNPTTIQANIMPKEISPLGNYALSITWNDGHSSGIYPYSLFEQLSEENESLAK